MHIRSMCSNYRHYKLLPTRGQACLAPFVGHLTSAPLLASHSEYAMMSLLAVLRSKASRPWVPAPIFPFRCSAGHSLAARCSSKAISFSRLVGSGAGTFFTTSFPSQGDGLCRLLGVVVVAVVVVVGEAKASTSPRGTGLGRVFVETACLP